MSENFKIVEIKNDKKRFIQLLLIGDESEAMIDRYLQKGNLYVGISNDISIAVCVTLIIDNTTVEIKSLFSPHTKFFHRQLFQSYYRRGGDTPRYGLFEKR